jgi:hypothetical protein
LDGVRIRKAPASAGTQHRAHPISAASIEIEVDDDAIAKLR